MDYEYCCLVKYWPEKKDKDFTTLDLFLVNNSEK